MQTMTQKILAAHANLSAVSPGQLIVCNLDLVLGNDVTTPVAIEEFARLPGAKIFNKSRVALVMDHFTPNKDIKAAAQCKACRTFARQYGVENFFDVGDMGIEHALIPERGLVTAGDVVIGADSHTCTYGALGAFSTGVGSTDMAAGMATGKAWFKVPPALRFTISGTFAPYVTGKDVILHIIGKIGVDGALYKSMEFGGDLSALTMDDRLCMANMAIEAGAKNGIFEVDSQTLAFLQAVGARAPKVYAPDAGAMYEQTFAIDLSKIPLMVALPHLPENAKPVTGVGNLPVDQVVIGSCTNGRLSDLKAAAEILAGRKVDKNVRAIVIPATQKIYLQAMEAGYLKTFVEAGCAVSTPTCGPCLGGHMGILAKGERAVATTNRNFVGRMGHPESEVVLAGPYVAAASAVLGRVAGPDEL